MLPGAPEWKSKAVSLTGNATKAPTFLFYRDALECVEYLFGNPIFANGIDFCPARLYHDSEQTIRMYTEWMTGNAAWEMQVYPFPHSDSIYTVLSSRRKYFQLVQHFLAPSSHPTRPTSQS